jgi:hypothetical protein
MADRDRGIVRDGVISGAIGATAVAVWFLIVDTIAGRPLFTPQVLGDAFLGVFGAAPGFPVNVLGYTIFHYAAFIAVGMLAATIIRASRRTPSVLAGFLILFVAFEIGFQGFVALLSLVSPLRGLAWTQILVGNLIAATLMGTYLWRVNPGIGRRLALALNGKGE